MRMFEKGYRYKNLTFLLMSLIFAFFLFQNETVHFWLTHLGKLGYLGAFIAGVLFVSTFTVASAIVIILVLAESLSVIQLGIIAGLGAMLGDLIIFNSVRNKDFISEIRNLFEFFKSERLSHLIHTPYFSWTLPVVGALIIASPLPDELGVSLMGISKMKPKQFLLTSFLLNSFGVILIILASTVIAP